MIYKLLSESGLILDISDAQMTPSYTPMTRADFLCIPKNPRLINDLRDLWIPKIGERVEIIQDGYEGRGTVMEKHCDTKERYYYDISMDNTCDNVFRVGDQMIPLVSKNPGSSYGYILDLSDHDTFYVITKRELETIRESFGSRKKEFRDKALAIVKSKLDHEK